MDKLTQSWNTTASIGLAIAIPYIIFKVTKRITLQRSCKALRSKVVLITGASGGLGEAIAHQFQKNGCLLVLCARRREQLEQVANDLIKINPNLPPIIYPLDVTDITSIPGHINEILKKAGQIDILINNSGIISKDAIISTEIDVQKKVMDVNYFGSLAITKAVLPSMLQIKSGHIVFISSVSGLISIPYRSAYCASKHAMQAFADSLRAEIHADNIQVTVISPGYIKTDISHNALDGQGRRTGQSDPLIETGYSSEFVAKATLDTVALKNKELVICTIGPHFGIWLRKFWPSLYFKVMERWAVTHKPVENVQ